jgi:TfoX/Sxy family transcriptional regulator of competence genes
MADNDAYRLLVDELLADPEVTEGQMMGNPALKLGRAMFGGLFDDELIVKVGRERAAELIEAGRAQPFDPSGAGRPFKDWAQVHEPPDDWLALAEEAKALARG